MCLINNNNNDNAQARVSACTSVLCRRLHRESKEQKEAKLQQIRDDLGVELAELRDYSRNSLAAESVQQREARLQQLSQGLPDC